MQLVIKIKSNHLLGSIKGRMKMFSLAQAK